MPPTSPFHERFTVVYRIAAADEKTARARAEDICIEQTVEFSLQHIHDNLIREHILGRIESLEAYEAGAFRARINFAVETTAFEFTQFLNVLFGNTSLKAGILVEDFELPAGLVSVFKGPHLGREGLRRVLGKWNSPLLCAVLKPMGTSVKELAKLAYQFALGGIDIIKDDHGITNQPFSPFFERVKYCAEAVAQANNKTGKHSIYVANITARYDEIIKRARLARKNGAGGFLIAPGLTGFEVVRKIADDPDLNLPILSHPSFLGSFVAAGPSGVSPGVIFVKLPRLAGADAVIYPNYGGRFFLSEKDCQGANRLAGEPMAHIKQVFSCPGGGVTLKRLPELLSFYGKEAIFIIGSDIYNYNPDLTESCRYFCDAIDGACRDVNK